MKLVLVGDYKFTKDELLTLLYDRKLEMKVHVFTDETCRTVRILDVDLKGLDGKPDCLIGSFSENWYVRTPKGLRGEEYSTMSGLVGAVKNEMVKVGKKVYVIELVKFGTKEVVAGFKE